MALLTATRAGSVLGTESDPSMRRSWWDRSFSRMGPGSLRGSIFTLVAASIGAGVLTLPYVCRTAGLAVGLILITAGMMASFWSLHLLIGAAEAYQTRRYLSICELAGGNLMGALYQVAICVQQCGAILGYQIISTDPTCA